MKPYHDHLGLSAEAWEEAFAKSGVGKFFHDKTLQDLPEGIRWAFTQHLKTGLHLRSSETFFVEVPKVDTITLPILGKYIILKSINTKVVSLIDLVDAVSLYKPSLDVYLDTTALLVTQFQIDGESPYSRKELAYVENFLRKRIHSANRITILESTLAITEDLWWSNYFVKELINYAGVVSNETKTGRD